MLACLSSVVLIAPRRVGAEGHSLVRLNQLIELRGQRDLIGLEVIFSVVKSGLAGKKRFLQVFECSSQQLRDS